jgi:phosphatidylethanolamine/phosphatidyl-N-methylethanolamine N-methyltransferase
MTWTNWRWSLYAPFYDAVAAWAFRSARRRSLARLELVPGERVLLLGAGTGLDLEALPVCRHQLALTAVDLSPAMLGRLERRARRLGLAVTTRVMDARRLDLPAASFDAVVAHLVLAVVPDPEQVTREIARVLRPGGRLAVFDKFLPDGTSPSAPRRLANLAARVVATDLNRQLGPLLAGAGLDERWREPSVGRGLFVLAGADKPPAAD